MSGDELLGKSFYPLRCVNGQAWDAVLDLAFLSKFL